MKMKTYRVTIRPILGGLSWHKIFKSYSAKAVSAIVRKELKDAAFTIFSIKQTKEKK